MGMVKKALYTALLFLVAGCSATPVTTFVYNVKSAPQGGVLVERCQLVLRSSMFTSEWTREDCHEKLEPAAKP